MDGHAESPFNAVAYNANFLVTLVSICILIDYIVLNYKFGHICLLKLMAFETSVVIYL